MMRTSSLRPASRVSRPGACLALLVISGCAQPQTSEPLTSETSGHIAMSSALQDALENRASGEVEEWWNIDTGDRGTVTPVRTFMSAGGLPCREYRLMTVRGDADGAFSQGIACRDVDGVWKDGD